MSVTNRNLRAKHKKEESPFIQKVIEIKRVSKKTEGGNRLSFNCLAVLGDGQGKVGTAYCRAPDVFSAIKKAYRKAQSEMINFTLIGEQRTIPHRIEYKAGTAHILLKPAPAGTGLIVGGAMRAVVEAAGIKNIVGKNLGTRNKKSTVDATIKALSLLKKPEQKLTSRKKKQEKSKKRTK